MNSLYSLHSTPKKAFSNNATGRPYLAPLLRYNDLLVKNRKFYPPLSFSALVRGDPLRIYEKALWFLKLESFRQPTVKI